MLVFLLVEETKRRSLEDLDLVFAVPKRTFMRYQVRTYLPWFFRHYVLRRRRRRDSSSSSVADEKPSLYIDLIWGKGAAAAATTAGVSASGVQDPRKLSTAATAAEPEALHAETAIHDDDDDERGGPLDRDADVESVDSLHR